MSAVLNTNTASLYAAKSLESAQSKMATSVERLSSGYALTVLETMLLAWVFQTLLLHKSTVPTKAYAI
jgi:hypothetical protein